MSEPTVIVAEKSNSRIIVVAAPSSVVIRTAAPASRVISAVGGALNLYRNRGIVNYDGGRAGTHYGDLAVIDGGGAADGRRNSI
jgi:hypothetical protein